MAIIKCPECGHQISDRAPICPSCGVRIADQVTKCTQCGETFFKDLLNCPRCHHANVYRTEIENNTHNNLLNKIETTNDTETVNNNTNPQQNEKKAKKKNTPIIIGFIIALVICGVGYFLYYQAQNNKEQEAYQFAMNSTDPIVLQDYLDRFKDAPTAHIDSIQAHLSNLQIMDQEWANALISNSKTALQNYLDNHPNTPHKQEALQKIDSLDWISVQHENNLNAYQTYLDEHPNGMYVDNVKDAIKQINAKTVQPEEKTMINNLFNEFFQYINDKDVDALKSMVNPVLTSFLGKTDATRNDVETFLHKLYREDVANMNWHLLNNFKIDKKEIGDQEYEYTVNFAANQDVEKIDGSTTKAHYRIKAKVNPNAKITEFNMTRIIQ